MAETNYGRQRNTDANDPNDQPNKFFELSGQLIYPEGLTTPGSSDAGPFIEIAAFKYERGFRTNNQEQVLYKVHLPFPFQGVSFTNQVNYDQFSAILGRGPVTAENFGSQLTQAGASILAQTVSGSAAGIVANGANAANLAGLDADRIKNQASAAFGLTFNPRMELAFAGNQLRTYQFQYIILPRNAVESRNIQNIIAALEDSSYPDYNDEQKVFLTYPDEFVLSFYNPDGSPIKGCPLIPDCFLSGFSYQINPNTASRVFSDGTPTSYAISLQFSESNYLTRREIRQLRNRIIPSNT